MKRSILDILACPIDKHYPLELIELEIKEEIYKRQNHLKEKQIGQRNIPKVHNEVENTSGTDRGSGEPSQLDKVIVIVDGILYCHKCLRFYPIIDEIPIMLPDELREKKRDLEFLAKWRDELPEKILKHANPWHM